MNSRWKMFLSDRQVLSSDFNDRPAIATDNISEKIIFPLTHLGILKVTGKDAAKLLQGQITCNVNDINESSSRIAAMCNPKGRVIATFIMLKKEDCFLLVLPTDLLDVVKSKLKMYVLRSDAKIEDSSDEFCLLGLSEPLSSSKAFATENLNNDIFVNLPGPLMRKVLITVVDNAIQYWAQLSDDEGYRQASPSEWRYFDIISGIPWVTTTTSEEFIPQMLNLDKLGGISFNKGCYTGQEIVARTHYLGKIKRELYLAECNAAKAPEANTAVINLDNKEQDVVGTVLQSEINQHNPQNCKLLIVLQTTETGYHHLGLIGDGQARLSLLPLAYD